MELYCQETPGLAEASEADIMLETRVGIERDAGKLIKEALTKGTRWKGPKEVEVSAEPVVAED